MPPGEAASVAASSPSAVRSRQRRRSAHKRPFETGQQLRHAVESLGSHAVARHRRSRRAMAASVGMRRRAWLSIAAGPEPRLGDLDQPPGRQLPPSTGRQGRQTGPAARCRLDEHLGRYEHGNPVSLGKRRISRVPTASSTPWGGVPAGSAVEPAQLTAKGWNGPALGRCTTVAPGSGGRAGCRRRE